ncbi:unnamed protein product [Ilex paraguariensis]|uniref:LOB domain-containing protein n=1 Tax=Ilex paraguariensis TaxID=185542 RepID=A0ABC8R6B1_9AQUA
MNGDATINMYGGACAACRHQRKRCDPNCQLAKYFPASKSEDFQNVYRLFGVSNLLKILNVVAEDERDKSIETLVMEAKIRKDHPVHGTLGVEKELRAQIEACEKELDFVQKQLSFSKEIRNLQKLKENLEAQLDESALAVLPTSLEQTRGPCLAKLGSTPPMSQLLDGSLTQTSDMYYQGAAIKPSNIHPMDEIMDSYQNEQALANFEESGESSAKFKAPEKLPIAHVQSKATEDEDGLPNKGKQGMSKLLPTE